MNCIHCVGMMEEFRSGQFVQMTCKLCNYSAFLTSKYGNEDFYRDHSIGSQPNAIQVARFKITMDHETHIIHNQERSVIKRLLTDEEVRRVMKNPNLIVML